MRFSIHGFDSGLQIHHMKVDIEIKISSESLDKSYRTSLAPDFFVKPAFLIEDSRGYASNKPDSILRNKVSDF